MESYKLRVKIGEHEFEAEGDPETVKQQFDAFHALLGTLRNQSPKDIPLEAPPSPDTPAPPANIAHVPLERIMKVQGRIVSLTVAPPTLQDSALLVLLGNKELRNNEMATGQEIGDGLAQSGRPVSRVDRVMEKMVDDAYVLKSGFKRGTRYRLSNTGLQKALAVARELIATLP